MADTTRVLAEQALPLAADLCRRFEGLKLRPYLCPAGVPTIGYGCTFYEDGKRVQLSDQPITKERAELLLQHHLRTECLPPVMRHCPEADTPGRLAALLDWTFNFDGERLAASTLRKRVNARDWPAVAVELKRWVMSKGQRLPGLIARREAEAALL